MIKQSSQQPLSSCALVSSGNQMGLRTAQEHTFPEPCKPAEQLFSPSLLLQPTYPPSWHPFKPNSNNFITGLTVRWSSAGCPCFATKCTKHACTAFDSVCAPVVPAAPRQLHSALPAYILMHGEWYCLQWRARCTVCTTQSTCCWEISITTLHGSGLSRSTHRITSNFSLAVACGMNNYHLTPRKSGCNRLNAAA